MSATALLPNHLRPRREKVFGHARGIPLDGNAKARLKAIMIRLGNLIIKWADVVLHILSCHIRL